MYVCMQDEGDSQNETLTNNDGCCVIDGRYLLHRAVWEKFRVMAKLHINITI